jgi:diaminohydroxyphosphoribosylaminopyrimidine deaminase/5-amino-6-(5-phosphoribosylamino)uracil reductase
MTEVFHRQMMRRALNLARRGVGKTAPNPAVGCVIVLDGQIVGEGWHRKAGTPHAEVHALQQAGDRAQGASVYVTLEPCSHHGRTPPCAEALIAARVGQVFVGMVDPNPVVSGRGVKALQAAGIAVTVGVCEPECCQLNEPFIKQMITGRPFVLLKMAATLDGWSATTSGDSKWITSESSRTLVHRLRSRMDAIMVGIETVLADDPLLTCRHVKGRNPIRIIVDSRLRLPLAGQICLTAAQIPTIVATVSDDVATIAALTAMQVDVLVCRSESGQVDLNDLLERLGQKGIQSILLEGGASLAGAALAAGLVDKVALFYAPKLLGGAGTPLLAGSAPASISDALPLHNLKVRRCGDDILVEGYLRNPCLPD